MVVAYCRRVAADITGLLAERLGEEAVACVISAQATDPPELSRHPPLQSGAEGARQDVQGPGQPAAARGRQGHVADRVRRAVPAHALHR